MKTLMILALLFPAAAFSGALSPSSHAEIAHLLAYLAGSGCEFNRNGVWHKPEEARLHLEKKYKYLLKKSQIGSTEDFIAKAATKSSASGDAYEVKCSGQAVLPSARFMADELKHYRSNRPAKMTGH